MCKSPLQMIRHCCNLNEWMPAALKGCLHALWSATVIEEHYHRPLHRSKKPILLLFLFRFVSERNPSLGSVNACEIFSFSIFAGCDSLSLSVEEVHSSSPFTYSAL